MTKRKILGIFSAVAFLSLAHVAHAALPPITNPAAAKPITAQEREALACRKNVYPSAITETVITPTDRVVYIMPENPTALNDWCLFLAARKNSAGENKDYARDDKGRFLCTEAQQWYAKNQANGTTKAEIRVNFDPKFGQCLMKFIQFLEDKKGFRPLINSGVRNDAEQNEIWARSCQGAGFAAGRPGVPGNHNRGIAADLQLPFPPDQAQRSAMAHDSGLALDFNVPNDKPHVQATGPGCSSGSYSTAGPLSPPTTPGATTPSALSSLANLFRPQQQPMPLPLQQLPQPYTQIGTAFDTGQPLPPVYVPPGTGHTTPPKKPPTPTELLEDIIQATTSSSTPTITVGSTTRFLSAEELQALREGRTSIEYLTQQQTQAPANGSAPNAPTAGATFMSPEGLAIAVADRGGNVTPEQRLRAIYLQIIRRISLAIDEILRILRGEPRPAPIPPPQQAWTFEASE